MTPEAIERFDALVEREIEQLPDQLAALLEQISVVVLDRPTPEIMTSLGLDPDDPGAAEEICGLHSGIANTEQSVEHDLEMPSQIHLFRDGIVGLAGGWEPPNASEQIAAEIRITLLHELGHQFGLDEDDLDALGYA